MWPWHGISRGGPRDGSLPFILRFRDDRSDESIAAPRQGLDPTLAAGSLGEDTPQRRDLNGKVAVFDRLAGPRGLDQRVLQDHRAGLFDQYAQNRDRPTAERYWRVSVEQQVALRIQPEWPQQVNRHHWRT